MQQCAICKQADTATVFCTLPPLIEMESKLACYQQNKNHNSIKLLLLVGYQKKMCAKSEKQQKVDKITSFQKAIRYIIFYLLVDK